MSTALLSNPSDLPVPVVSAFRWVPDFARGLVRDLRVRWALEEIGRPYTTHLLAGNDANETQYRSWQPFGQVPAFEEGDLRLFESGAILLYLGEQDERLLPGDTAGRWDATAWLIAALNSIEPVLARIAAYDLFYKDQDWAPGARAAAVGLAEKRLQSLSTSLADKDWLAGRFTVADIVMVTVLRGIGHTGLVSGFANLAAYVERGEQRPAFRRALEAQNADFDDVPPA